MNPRDYYKKLIAEVSDDDAKKLLSILVNHIGKNNKIDRRQLVIEMYSKYTESLWRKMRAAKAILIEVVFSNGKKLSIGSSSGEGGYWIIDDETERMNCLSESGSRFLETKKVYENQRDGMTWQEAERWFSNGDLQEAQAELFGRSNLSYWGR